MIRALFLPAFIVFFFAIGSPSGHSQSRFTMPLITETRTPNQIHIDNLQEIVRINQAERQVDALSQQADALRGQARIAQFQHERKVAQEEDARIAYQIVADEIAKIHPDDPTSLAAIYKLKSHAGQYLNSQTMHELFGPIERRIEENHKRLSDLFAKTGLASPVLNSATGLIDWEATWRLANAQVQKNEHRKSPSLSMPLATLAAISLLAAIAIHLFQARRLASDEEVETTEKSPSYSTICPHCDWSQSQLWQPVSGAPTDCKCCGKSFAPVWEKT